MATLKLLAMAILTVACATVHSPWTVVGVALPTKTTRKAHDCPIFCKTQTSFFTVPGGSNSSPVLVSNWRLSPLKIQQELCSNFAPETLQFSQSG